MYLHIHQLICGLFLLSLNLCGYSSHLILVTKLCLILYCACVRVVRVGRSVVCVCVCVCTRVSKLKQLQSFNNQMSTLSHCFLFLYRPLLFTKVLLLHLTL